MSGGLGKRFVTIAEYQRQTGLSYPTVKNGIETGQIRAIKTEGGNYKIDLQADNNTELSAVIERLDQNARLLNALCSHLGVIQ